MGFARLLLLFFSLCLHGGLAGVLWLFSDADRAAEERVYQVSLAEFASPRPSAPAAPEPQPESPPPPPEPEVVPPEPEVVPPEPEVAPEPPKEPEAKPISSKKDKKKPASPKPAQKPKAAPQPPAPAQGPTGPQPSQMGGYAAYKSDQLDQRPSISRRAAPDYPSKARRMNIEGKVLVQMVVDTSGMPQSCTVAKADPPGYFEDAALAAARKMRFIPGKLKGRPVNTLVLLPFAFQLR